jgi:hypothetical protein
MTKAYSEDLRLKVIKKFQTTSIAKHKSIDSIIQNPNNHKTL